MKINPYKGFFVDFEGLDGSGISTQGRLVALALKNSGVRPYVTKEPTAGPVGKLVGRALKREFNSLPPASLQLLFAADRGRHLYEEIVPRLKKEMMVITDRYAWSSIAFGSVDLDREWLFDLNKNFILPDLTILIDVAPEVCLERICKERSGVELFEEEEKLQQAWATYHYLASKYWWAHFAIVDGEQEKEKVTEEILLHLKNHPKFSG